RLRRRLGTRLPAGAVFRRAPYRRLGRAADPHRQVGLHRLRQALGAREMIMDALEIDLVLAPQPPDHLEPLIGLAPAGFGVEVEAFPFRPERAADAESRKQPPVR